MTAIARERGKDAGSSSLPAAIVATSCGFVLVGRGAAETFGVFLLPIEQSLGIGHGEATSIYALAMIAIGLTGPFAGALIDRFGPRFAYALGTFVLIAAFLATSAATALWQLQLTLGVGVGLATACVGTATQGPLIGRWFKGRESTIFGVISGTAGVGALIFTPVSQVLIEAWGWRSAYQALALAVSILLLPLAFLPWKRIAKGPQETGVEVEPGVGGEARQASGGHAGAAWGETVREPLIWRLYASHFLTCAAVFGMQVLVVAYLVDSGYPPLVAAGAFGLAGLAAAVGVVLFGWLADRVGWYGTLTGSFVATALGLGSLWAMSWDPQPWFLALYVVTFGLSVGSRGPLIAGLVIRRFAGPVTGRVLGGLVFAFGLGSAFGSWLTGTLHEATHGYGAGFLVSCTCLLLAFTMWWPWPDPSRADLPAFPR